MTSLPRQPRKPRSDSTAERLRIAQGLNRQIDPPVHIPLDGDDLPFWNAIVAEFAQADWTDHQLQLAAFLARAMADLRSSQRMLREEGLIISKPTGDCASNPRCATVGALARHVSILRRTLAIHVRGKAPSARDAAAKRAANLQTEREIRQADADLLA